MGLVALIGVLIFPKYWNRILAGYLGYLGFILGYLFAQLVAAQSPVLAILGMFGIIIAFIFFAIAAWSSCEPNSSALDNTRERTTSTYRPQKPQTNMPRPTIGYSREDLGDDGLRQGALSKEEYYQLEQTDSVLSMARAISDTFMHKHRSNKYQITGNHSQYLTSSHASSEEWLNADLPARAEAFIRRQLQEKPRWFDGLQERRAQYDADYTVYESKMNDLYTRLSEPHLKEKQKMFHSIKRPRLSRYVIEVSARWHNGDVLKYEPRKLGYTYEEVMKIIERCKTTQQLWKPEDWVQKEPPIDDFEGIYILHNTTDDLYYVGQAVSVHKRLKQHFLHGGNYDIYADYKYGKKFTVEVHPLKDSGFHTLNAQERHYIEAFDAVNHGYNKTHGNLG